MRFIMLASNIIYEPEYQNYQIQFHPSGIHGEIINTIHALLTKMTAPKGGHCKVFFLRFDLRFPDGSDYPTDNSVIEDFISHYIKTFYRLNIDASYIWVREQNSSLNHHYHIALFLDGSKIEHDTYPLQIAERLWALKLNLPGLENHGLVHYCRKGSLGNQDNSVMLIRKNPDFQAKFQSVMFISSYLAKTYSKGTVDPRVRQFGNSRI